MSICCVLVSCNKEEPVHTYSKSDWIKEKEATCTEEGLKYIECTLCQEKLTTETIPTILHKYENNICTSCGKSKPLYELVIYEENGTKFINM